mmetsp:Transcript_13297/g.39657  ORF Transcript_13297/g.39657 Transcript_13297/m.39657 type:complete len:387 (-) Transcript_13297:29-1189(-)
MRRTPPALRKASQPSASSCRRLPAAWSTSSRHRACNNAATCGTAPARRISNKLAASCCATVISISRAADRKGCELLRDSATRCGMQPLRRTAAASTASEAMATVSTVAQFRCSTGGERSLRSNASNNGAPPAAQAAAAASGKRSARSVKTEEPRTCMSRTSACRRIAVTTAAAQVKTGGPGVNSTRSSASKSSSPLPRSRFRVAAAPPQDSANAAARCSTAAQASREGFASLPPGAAQATRLSVYAAMSQERASEVPAAWRRATLETGSQATMGHSKPGGSRCSTAPLGAWRSRTAAVASSAGAGSRSKPRRACSRCSSSRQLCSKPSSSESMAGGGSSRSQGATGRAASKASWARNVAFVAAAMRRHLAWGHGETPAFMPLNSAW